MLKLVGGFLAFTAGTVAFGLVSAIALKMAGRPFNLHEYFMPCLLGGILGLLVFQWNLRSKRYKEKLFHLNLVLQSIRDVNRLITQKKDRDLFLQGICDILVKNKGYYDAWIALLNESDSWDTFAQAGLNRDFKQLADRLKKGGMITCCQRALSRPEIVVTDEPAILCDCPLASAYANTGALSIRMEHEKKVIGILTVSMTKDLVFSIEEQQLVKEVADDIIFGLHSIELEQSRRQAEQSLQASEKQFRTLVENALTGISIIQGERVVYQNKEQERLFGPLPRSYILADYNNIHPEDVNKVKKLSHDISSGNIQALDVNFRYAPIGDMAHLIWIHCRAHTITYRQKASILVNMMDMTKIKELEDLLLNQDKMASLGRVAAGIAHEIRNPLSGINIYLNTLEKFFNRSESKVKVDDVFQHLQSASRRIESVIRRVMDFSKPSEPNFTTANINQPIEEAIKLTAVTLRKSGIKLDKALTEDLPKCRLDLQQIEEVVLNLINNAADAMRTKKNNKKIKVISSVVHDNITVRVIDSGPGVTIANKNKVFDPFFTTKSDSTGIGLSICHRIITDHAGTLKVQNSEWGGAEFSISIPVIDT
ncbi:MAG: hypothetical protein DRI24_14125 [Deltaproteobacteria bacterium]|nr:MAG: hypothetical protein DRI24_14125 [Deltaproteobacteria bacterium]